MNALRPLPIRLRSLSLSIAAMAIALLAGCSARDYPQTAMTAHSDYARMLRGLNIQLLWWASALFVLIQGLLIVAVWKFRNRPGAPEPQHVHGNTALEIAWTIAPAIILTLVAVPTVTTILKTQGAAPGTPLKVRVIGHRWWWEYQYPDLGIVTANELHVPVNQTVAVEIQSADVIHSFWIPAVAGKRDAVPSHTNRLWFTADSTGEFPGTCAEFCGMSHANMRTKLFVMKPDEFQQWVAQQKGPPVEPEAGSLAAQGKQIFSQSACIGCHTINGVAAGVIGPNLTHIGSRTTLAAALFPNNPEEMAHWISDAPGRKPGSQMPAIDQLGITKEQVPAIVAYLQGLK